MDNNTFEAKMREGEVFHKLRVPADRWTVVRVDGRGFSRFTAAHFQKPFDAAFHEHMVETARTLMTDLNALYTYTESDEISVLLPYDWNWFDRSQEKLVSISASIASVAFSRAAGHAAHFDSRVWTGDSEYQVTDYFRWRQSDSERCALNNWCYWLLRNSGQSASAASLTLESRSTKFKRELLQTHDIDFDAVPDWQRWGTGLYWGEFTKTGFDPVKQQEVAAIRRRIDCNSSLPRGDEYARFLAGLLRQPAQTG